MGAVQKLATVVIIGLVALATVLTVYIAREPDRRDEELTEQQQISIQRGTDLYITYCLQCHGPAGLGSSGGEENTRPGPALNQDGAGIPEENRLFNYQSDDPVAQQEAESFIRHRILNGAPSDPRQDRVMPAFDQDLSGEQVNDLVTLIQYGDWDYVYNTAVTETGVAAAEAECAENNGEGEYCDHLEEAPPAYPTAPPPDVAEEDAEAGPDAGEEEADAEDTDERAPEGDSASASAEIEASDPYEWSESEITVKPGDTIAATNVGSLQHDFTVDELGINEDLPSGGAETVTITIPEDAEPGEYEFYCSVPGHREGGMVGTLIIEAP